MAGPSGLSSGSSASIGIDASGTDTGAGAAAVDDGTAILALGITAGVELAEDDAAVAVAIEGLAISASIFDSS